MAESREPHEKRVSVNPLIKFDRKDLDLLSKYTWAISKIRGGKYASAYVYLGKRKYCRILMHRLIMKAKPGQIVDHKNSNGLDNRRANLRLCTSQQNSLNSNKHKDNTSGYRGVSWHVEDKKWYARISINGKCKYIGSFEHKKDAALAYNKAAKKHHGEFARLNSVK